MLTFNLKKEWFEKIKSGEKTHEYRRQTSYWITRILNLDMRRANSYALLEGAVKTSIKVKIDDFLYNEACFACGYPKAEDKEKRLYAKIVSVTCNVNGLETDLKINEPVFDIEFELIKE